MRLLLIEDHQLIAESLQFFLTEIDPTIVCTTASTIAQGLQAMGPFDLILLDLNLPDTSGLNGLKAIRQAFDGVPVAMLSAEVNTDVIRQAINEGAMGFVPKSASSQVFIAAMRLILAGGTYLPPHAFAAWQGPHTGAASGPVSVFISAEPASAGRAENSINVAHLTARQLEVLMKAVQGKPNKVIARETNLAEGTVKSHLSAAFRLINVSNRTEAVFKVAQLGLKLPAAMPSAASGSTVPSA